ncbi:MAG: MotA/TolQ/ExbB proton channel family protein [Rhodospirillaceae bacterium]|nr:MotA/TolQ/ExbB proton channel family protein [Rhodospirillaceae bacterium]
MKRTIVLALAASLAAASAAAQQAPASKADLLTQIEQRAAEEARLNEQRIAEFNAAPADRQGALLTAAQDRAKALRVIEQQLSTAFSANELKIATLNKDLREKAAALGLAEVFGLARQTANDVASTLQQSLISTQFPPQAGQQARDEFMRAFSASRSTPTIDDLTRVWVEIQREVVASGQVARYQTRVVQPNGDPTTADVIRIGPFTAMANGQFLQYAPALRELQVLPRQLPDEFMEVARAFTAATSGYHTAVVDPNRGVLLGLYVERPTLEERIELGEEIGYIIIIVGLAGTFAFFYQLVVLVMTKLAVTRQLKNLNSLKSDNPLGRVLLAFKGDAGKIEESADVAELRITEAVMREVPRLNRFQSFLRLVVAAGPLLGLIGTVVGMILTFQSITESGSSDPRLMAAGIGQAMIATVLGLGIAIPMLFAGALLNSLSRGIVQLLDEQSAGMLAESIERRRHAR